MDKVGHMAVLPKRAINGTLVAYSIKHVTNKLTVRKTTSRKHIVSFLHHLPLRYTVYLFSAKSSGLEACSMFFAAAAVSEVLEDSPWRIKAIQPRL